MFIDYYSILDISHTSSPEIIKKSYRLLSLKWHPDKNPGIDTAKKMVEINEAYYVLNDPIKKERYDREYLQYKNIVKRKTFSETINNSNRWTNISTNPCSSSDFDYQFHDSKVKDDIKEAHKVAKELVDEFMQHLKSTAKDAAQGAWSDIWPYLIWVVVFPFIFLLIRSCQ